MLACAHERTAYARAREQAYVQAYTCITLRSMLELIDFQNGKNEPDGARSVIRIIIVMSVLPNPFSSMV